MLVFWVVTLCGLVGRYQRFGGNTASVLRAKVQSLSTVIPAHQEGQAVEAPVLLTEVWESEQCSPVLVISALHPMRGG
jgi:hypothetical protein